MDENHPNLLIGKIPENLSDFSKKIGIQPASLYSTINFSNHSGVVRNRLFSSALAISFGSPCPLTIPQSAAWLEPTLLVAAAPRSDSATVFIGIP
jgi:hypothetical protein